MKRMPLALLLLVAVLIVGGCSESPSPTDPSAVSSRVTVTTLQAGTAAPVAGSVVELVRDGGESKSTLRGTTDATGSVTLTAPFGLYLVEITPPAGYAFEFARARPIPQVLADGSAKGVTVYFMKR